MEVDLDENGDAVSSLGDTLSSFENINGSNAGDDVISGNNLSNVLNGQDGNDLLNGEGGDDNLVGGAGNDTLVGGAGNDTFVLQAGSGIDLVTDFESGDTLNFNTIFGDAAQAFGAATEDGGDVAFDLGSGNSLTVENVAISDLADENLSFS